MPVPQYACSANPTAEGSEVARPQAGIPKESAGRSKNTRSVKPSLQARMRAPKATKPGSTATRGDRFLLWHVGALKGVSMRAQRQLLVQGHGPQLSY